MEIRTRTEHGWTLVEAVGDLTLDGFDERLESALLGPIGEECRGVVVDLSAVGELDRFGLGQLVRCQAAARAKGREIALVWTSPRPWDLVTLAGLVGAFRIHRDLDRAVAERRGAE